LLRWYTVMEDFNVSLLTSTLVGMVHSPERATRAKALIVEVENFILRKLSFWKKLFWWMNLKIVKNIILLCVLFVFFPKKANRKNVALIRTPNNPCVLRDSLRTFQFNNFVEYYDWLKFVLIRLIIVSEIL
jgi:hypothetical protein